MKWFDNEIASRNMLSKFIEQTLALVHQQNHSDTIIKMTQDYARTRSLAKLRKTFLVLRVFPLEMRGQQFKQVFGYPVRNFLSDVGGTLGECAPASSFTIF